MHKRGKTWSLFDNRPLVAMVRPHLLYYDAFLEVSMHRQVRKP